MAQKAFYFNMTECVGCHACQVACRDRNALYNVGEIFRKVDVCEGGKFPNPFVYHLSISCNHCGNPACTAACPTGAMYKDEETGLVLHDDEMCIGCGACVNACPYGEPIMIEKEGKKVSAKCDGCYTLVSKGMNPVCVDACGMRALEFGDLSDLMAKHPDAVSEIKVLPAASQTTPALFITPVDEALTEEVEQIF